MTDLQQSIGQCGQCKGEVYHDGTWWRHRANDKGLRECPMGPDLYQLIAKAIGEHHTFSSYSGGVQCDGCSWRWSPQSSADDHVAQVIGDMLIDLAGTGQLLASIDRVARATPDKS